jgi:hypothetical protein
MTVSLFENWFVVLARIIRTPRAKKENARGERAFSLVNLGVVGGLLIIHVAFGGLVKNHVNSLNS